MEAASLRLSIVLHAFSDNRKAASMNALTLEITSRLDRFSDRIAEGLAAKSIDLGILTDQTLAIAARCSRLAAESVEPDYADACVRFAIELIATPALVSEEEAAVLLVALERLTIRHLLLLQFVDDPSRWLAAKQVELGPDGIGRRTFIKFLQGMFPGWIDPPELLGSMEQVLRACGLLTVAQFGQTQEPGGLFERKTSEAGRLLVALCLPPLTVSEKKPAQIVQRSVYPPHLRPGSPEWAAELRAARETIDQQSREFNERKRAEHDAEETRQREIREAAERKHQDSVDAIRSEQERSQSEEIERRRREHLEARAKPQQ